MSGDGSSRAARDALLIGAVLAVALAYRLWLGTVYPGWEESDYGNLAMSWEALQTGFTRLRMEYQPLYYVAAGLLCAATGDARPAALAVSLGGSLATVAAAMWIGLRLFDPRVALAAGLFLAFQPETALYGSTTLREPFFAGLLWCGIAALVSRRGRLGAGFVAASFLVRFDSLFSNMPGVLWHAWREGGRRVARVAGPAALLGAAVAGWAVYCRVVHGTFLFFGNPVSANLGNGGIAGLAGRGEIARNGLDTVWALLTRTLTERIGWAFLLLGVAGAVLLLRERGTRPPAGTLVVFFVLDLGFWLGVGFIGQHSPDHNLYWKWLVPVVPHFALLGSYAFARGLDRLAPRSRPVRAASWGALATATALVFAAQTEFQVTRSRAWYGPQKDLAVWIERTVAPGSTLLMDGIPWGWVARRPHPFRILSWADQDLPDQDRLVFGRFLERNSIDYVLFFREDWARAGNAAAFLEAPRPHVADRFVLMPLRDEAEYGFVFYRVDPRERHPSLAGDG